MKTTTVSTRLQGYLDLFDLHTNFFGRAIEGVSQEDMHNRLNTKANHMAWLTGAVIAQRFLMISETNPDEDQTRSELFKDHQGIQDGITYPDNTVYLNDWERVTPMARMALIQTSNEKLDSIIDMGGMKMTFYELVSFTIYREASMIGQLALWRRLLGYPALRYD